MKIVYKIITVVVGISFLYAIFTLVQRSGEISILPYVKQINPFKLAISFALYIVSHFLRSVRIALMIGRQDYSFLTLVNKQFYTNGINLILPFKLGEFYRIVELNKLFRDSERTFLTVLAERTLDFLFLFVGLFVALYITNYSLLNLRLTLFVGGTFIASVLLIYYVLPENLRSFNLFLAKRYTKKSVTRVLAFSHMIYSLIISIKEILRRKSSTIILLTALVWFCEIGGLFFITDFLDIPHALLLAFFVFLSSLIPSGSLGLGSLQFAFYLLVATMPAFPYLPMSMIYQAYIFFPAILISFVLYMKKKIGEWKTVKVKTGNI